jgi:hypothetical protein
MRAYKHTYPQAQVQRCVRIRKTPSPNPLPPAGCLGITLSYHRQLSHRSFTTPKWLEYTLAYCGVLAVQGDPLEWVSAKAGCARV